MALNSSQAFYLLIEDKGIASMSMTLAELYEKKKSNDGFLYMSYASQGLSLLINLLISLLKRLFHIEMFGTCHK